MSGDNDAIFLSNLMTQVQNLGIVGAGMAGLTMSWILQYIGHNVRWHLCH